MVILIVLHGCTPSAPSKPPNVIVFSIDSLRADHLGAYRYPLPTSPSIDRYAVEGLVFEQAFSTTSWTLPAHVSLFTGTDDLSHTVVTDLAPLPETIPVLAEVLAANGYHTLGYFSGPYLHPGFGFARGFAEYVDCTSYGRAPGAPRAETNELRPGELAASQRDVTNPILLEEIGARLGRELPEPYFLFVHFWDVHYDYIPPERYWRLFDPDYEGDFTGKRFERNPDFHTKMPVRDYRHALALYDGEIRYTDETIGEILGLLKARGLLENTLLVVTADHGDEFLEHGGRGHRKTLYDEVVRVPLILWHPGRIEPGRRSGPVSLIDVAPTVLALAGIEGGLASTGRSLLDPPDPDRAVPLELTVPQEGIEQVALRTADVKVIHHLPALFEEERWRGFDLLADPGELHPLAEEDPAAVVLREGFARLRSEERLARERGKQRVASGPTATPAIDAATLEQLESLGYVQ